MRVSVITTVYNEQETVAQLLESLLSQKTKPTEIVIVDGGSEDNTLQILDAYQKKYKFIHVYKKKGNIAKGRNFAIKKAKYDIVAQIDAGCIAYKDWLEKIVEPFEDSEIGVVAGFYRMTGDTPFQKAVAPFHGITPARFDPRSYLPSGRSMAFRKEVWELVGGYSETLQWGGEDTLFNYELLKAGVKFARVPGAIVDWEVPDTFLLTVSKFFKYAKGDAESRIWWHPGKALMTHNVKIVTIFIRYAVFLGLLILSFVNPIFFFWFILLFVFYTSWSIWKLQDQVTDMKAKLIIPIIQLSSDVAVMAGFLSGLTRT